MEKIVLVEAPKPKPKAKRSLPDYIKGARHVMNRFDIAGYEKAVAYARHALSISPKYVPAHALLGEAYSYWAFRLELNRSESHFGYNHLSYIHAKQAIDMAPELACSHRAMAVSMRRGNQSDPEGRKAEIVTAMDLEPNNPDNLYEHWRAFGYKIDDRSVHRALELNPKLTGALIDYGVVLTEAGRHEEAERFMIQAKVVSPKNTLVFYNLAMIQDRRGFRVEALKTLLLIQEEFEDDYLIQSGLNFLQ